MEETVGLAWDRLIGRIADRSYPDAAVAFDARSRSLGVFFRALGGPPAIRLVPAAALADAGPRRWLQRIAGAGRERDGRSIDEEALRLPVSIAALPTPALNEALYLWLAALAAATVAIAHRPWLERNQQATLMVLSCWPGMAQTYHRLVDAAIAERIAPDTLGPDEARAEHLIRRALRAPGSVADIVPTRRPVQSVCLWLDDPPLSSARAASADDERAGDGGRSDSKQGSERRLKVRRQASEKSTAPMILPFRAESILSFAQHVRIDRDEEDADDDPGSAADQLDEIVLTRAERPISGRVRLDLEVPMLEVDDEPVGDPQALPEWDYRRRIMMPAYCTLQERVCDDAPPQSLPRRLVPVARRLRRELEALTQAPSWLDGEASGDEIDLRAAIAHRIQPETADPRVYRRSVRNRRDIACLLLLDLSQSTDAHIDDHRRVIDVIGDSAFTFCDALSSLGDRFAVYGFSSRRRSQVRYHRVKGFDERFDDHVGGRISQLRPGDYTRLGAAVRQSTRLLEQQPSRRRVLLILTDGKPHDIDRYEGRHGVEDTRHALIEARRVDVTSFCLTIDPKPAPELDYLFGRRGYALLRRPERLPHELVRLYGELTSA